ncbi:hypothetical protein Taro_002083 [Colocasia esculenta]|uniref:Uncharacterized protein n=1 Tax=Colocasia esculenta TaxID=4460 RepID=A0A843TI28_COLES|nr:hypothetical protein [Colocasia esculenta]
MLVENMEVRQEPHQGLFQEGGFLTCNRSEFPSYSEKKGTSGELGETLPCVALWARGLVFVNSKVRTWQLLLSVYPYCPYPT